jgi:hypothetical protein
MSNDPLARYEKQIKRPLSEAERLAMGSAPPQGQSTSAGDPRKFKRQLRHIATKARRQELGLKAKGRAKGK